MSQLTADDLKTVLSLAVQVARADRQMAVYEKEIIDRLAETLELSDVEKAAVLDSNPGVEEALARLSSPAARAFMVKTLCAVAYSDGREHEGERELIEAANARLSPPLELKPWDQWEDYVEEVVDTLIEFKP